MFASFCSILLPYFFQKLSSGLAGLFGLPFCSICLASSTQKPSKTYGKSMVFAACFILLHFAALLLPRALLGAGWAFWAHFLEHLSCKLDPKTIKNLWKINGFCYLLHVAQFCFHTSSKSSPRGWLGFLGSLFGAIVLQTRPKNHQKPQENQCVLLFA